METVDNLTSKTSAVHTNNKPSKGPLALLIATRKGAFILRGGKNRNKWKLSEPFFLGHMVHHIVQDPRDRQTILMACRTGHLGPTVFRSTDFGKTWTEAGTPPAFLKAAEGETGRVLDHVFWLTPGHACEPGFGTPAPRLRVYFVARTAARTGKASRASMIIRCVRRGPEARAMELPTVRSCIRYLSTRAIRITCIWACRWAEFSKARIAGRIGSL